MVMIIKVSVTPPSRGCNLNPFCPLHYALGPHLPPISHGPPPPYMGPRWRAVWEWVSLFLGEGVVSQGCQIWAANCVG